MALPDHTHRPSVPQPRSADGRFAEMGRLKARLGEVPHLAPDTEKVVASDGIHALAGQVDSWLLIRDREPSRASIAEALEWNLRVQASDDLVQRTWDRVLAMRELNSAYTETQHDAWRERHTAAAPLMAPGTHVGGQRLHLVRNEPEATRPHLDA